jgi:hypothetical protein
MRDPTRTPVEGDILSAPPVTRTVTFAGKTKGGVSQVSYQETCVGLDTIRNGWCQLNSWRVWCRLKGAQPLRDCRVCGGSGFSGRGTGYDDVCSECGGQRLMPIDR